MQQRRACMLQRFCRSPTRNQSSVDAMLFASQSAVHYQSCLGISERLESSASHGMRDKRPRQVAIDDDITYMMSDAMVS